KQGHTQRGTGLHDHVVDRHRAVGGAGVRLRGTVGRGRPVAGLTTVRPAVWRLVEARVRSTRRTCGQVAEGGVAGSSHLILLDLSALASGLTPARANSFPSVEIGRAHV